MLTLFFGVRSFKLVFLNLLGVNGHLCKFLISSRNLFFCKIKILNCWEMEFKIKIRAKIKHTNDRLIEILQEKITKIVNIVNEMCIWIIDVGNFFCPCNLIYVIAKDATLYVKKKNN